MTILCVIPARGGSKRVPRKNLQMVGGKPLLAWSIEAALGVGLDPIVSSEDEEILATAKSCGATPLRRPLELSADDASTEGVLIHALNMYHGDWVMCLPPTSPMRDSYTISKVLETQRGHETDCVMTVTEYRGDLWQGGKFLTRLQSGAPRRQQDRVPLWEENSAVYLTNAQSLWMTRSVLGYGNVVGVPISREEGWDINDELDLRVADMLLKARPKLPPPVTL
jgi:CMP-N,N'-diacetyllegionaminic acid synthase